MYQNGGSLPADMTGVPRISDMMEQGSSLMSGLDVDMLPMDLDLGLADPDSQNYNALGAQPPAQSQQMSVDNGDAYALQNSNNNMSGAGAGPLPTGFGVQTSANSGSTLTEFTKRRNWSQRVIEEIRDLLHILTPDGRILYVSPSCKMLTGYESQQIVGRIITDFIHPDDSSIYIREFHESIASGNPLRFFYRFRCEDGTYTIFEAHGHPHLSSEAANFHPSAGANFCRGVFMMARPYPTKNATLLDSFLEHKIENERLTKRIADLKREEQEEQEAQERHWLKKVEGHSSLTPSETQRTDGQTESEPVSSSVPTTQPYNGMPPPAKPSVSNTALTRQNLDEVLAGSKPDSINDKMARYEGTHIETIEMLTGLRYRDGERSQGISTGDTSPALIRGDAGIAILVDRDRSGADKTKKKAKVADEYVCTDCGTLDSPEWRKGPNGPKTLCNACGLRWAKKEKKRQTLGGVSHPGQMGMQPSTTSS